MTSNIMLSAFKHKLIVELENNITNFTNDITYVETILRTAKNKRIREVVTKNIEKRKKKQYEELNNFFTKYTNFLMNKRDYKKYNLVQSLESKQQEKETFSDISSSYSTTASESEGYETLNDMHNTRRKLRDVLHCLKTNDEVFQKNEKSVHLFLELLRLLQKVTKESINTEKMQQLYEKSQNSTNNKLENKITKPEKKHNKIDENIINYLYNEDVNFPEMSDCAETTMPSTYGSKLLKGTTDNDELKNNRMDLLTNKLMNLLDDNSSTMDKFNSTNTSEVNVFLTNHLDKDILKQDTNTNGSKSMRTFNLNKYNIKNDMCSLKTGKNLNGHVSFFSNTNDNYLDNTNHTNSQNNAINELLNTKQKSALNKEIEQDINSSNSDNFSDSSDSSYNSDEENVDKSLGYKKYTITINKNGEGIILLNEINGSTPKFIHDFEINYQSESDENSNMGDFSANTSTNKSKNKKIFQFSFLKNGTKIDSVRKLYLSKNSQLRKLKFYDKHLDDVESYSDNSGTTGLNSSKKVSFEKNRTNENAALRKELSMIINDINNNRLKHLDDGFYNTESVEINKLRGIYLHMLENQRGLEKEVNFYKNELDTLNKNLHVILNKNNSNNITEPLDFQKVEILYKALEEKFTKNTQAKPCRESSQESHSLNEKNLEKQIIELKRELTIRNEELQKEKETVISLKTASETDKIAIAKVKSELKNNEKTKEELKALSQMCDKLMASVDEERKESQRLSNEVSTYLRTINDMTNELNALKGDKSFDNFKKSVLLKVNNTNGEMKILTDRIETLTEELEIKINNENILNEKIKKLKEKYSDNKKSLSFSNKKLKQNAILMKNMREEIDYLNEKIENLIEAVKYLKAEVKTYSSANKKVSKNKKDKINTETTKIEIEKKKKIEENC